VQIKAIACELPARRGLPLSRLSAADIVREAQRCGIVATLSNKTVWRWLNNDAIRPWHHRTWIFPRDPQFIPKAGRILELYARQWEGRPLQDDAFVVSADEKTSIQARIRKHPSLPPRPGRAARVEHEYTRGGAWAYLARAGCPSGEALRTLLAIYRHRALPPPGYPGHDPAALSRRPPGVLDHRQRFLASWTALRATP